MIADPKILIFIIVCCLSAYGLYLAIMKDNSHDPYAGLEKAIEECRAEERAKQRIADIKEIYTGLRIQMPHLSHEDAADRAVEIYEQRKLIS